MREGGIITKRIATLRKAAGLSQAALAERAGITQGMVSMMEDGSRTPSLTVAKGIAEALNTTIDELLKEDTDEPLPDD